MWKDGKSFKIGETVVDPTQEPYKSMSLKYTKLLFAAALVAL